MGELVEMIGGLRLSRADKQAIAGMNAGKLFNLAKDGSSA